MEKGSSLAVHPSVLSCFEVEYTGADVRVFALADLAFSVKVPNRLNECFENVRPFATESVVYVVGRDNVGFTSF